MYILGYEQPLWKILYQYITRHVHNKYFPISCDSWTDLHYFQKTKPQITNYSNYVPKQTGFITYIVRNVIYYHCTKC